MNPRISRPLNEIGDRTARSSAFTLVELLVSIVVLIIVLLLCTQVLVATVSTWNSGRSQADNFSKARIAMDILARDLAAEVIRQDVPAFFNATSPALIFYTKQQGLISSTLTGNRPLSRVYYSVVTAADGGSVLRRSVNGFNFGDDVGYSPAAWSIQMASPTLDADIGPGVLVMNYQFIGTDGLNVLPTNVNQAWTNSGIYPGIENLRAVTISLTVIDGQNLKILNSLGKLAQLQGNFSSSDPGPIRSFASAWQAQLDSASHPIGNGGIPLNVLRGLKTFERTVMLPALTRE